MIRQQRLQHHPAAAVVRHGMLNRLSFFQHLTRLQIGQQFFARLKPIQTLIGLWHPLRTAQRVNQLSVLIEDADNRQLLDIRPILIVPNHHLMVVGVMAGGDFHRAAALFPINIAIADNRNHRTISGVPNHLAN